MGGALNREPRNQSHEHHIPNLFTTVLTLVGGMQNVTAINLANQHGSEGVLSAAFKDETRRFSGIASGFRLVAFDFHKECGASRYHR